MKDPTRPVITVALGDSNPLVLSALSEIFEQDDRFSLVATSSTTDGLLGTVIRVPVDVGVIDWRLPPLGGTRLIEMLRRQTQPPRLVIYGSDDEELPRLAMAAGAAGFVLRSAEVDDLLTTCVDVAAGKMVFPYVDVRELQYDPIRNLSRKERETLDALAKGLTNHELAGELNISINTVKFHLSNVYTKLSVRNRAQAIAFYYARRLQDSIEH